MTPNSNNSLKLSKWDAKHAKAHSEEPLHDSPVAYRPTLANTSLVSNKGL